MNPTAFTILDGAMGTMLQGAGIPVGVSPETWNIHRPDVITGIGKRYIDAGAQVIYANTFGANRHKLPGADVKVLVTAGIQAAKTAACTTGARVALDIGPIGQLLEPLGSLPFDDAYETFREIVVAGAEAGADLIVFETMSDLYEVKAGVLAAKEHTSLPVWVTMTMEPTGRTYVGATIPAIALTLTGLGVDAIGFNCGLGPKQLLPMVKTLSEWTDLPMILKPNAGLPDPETGRYSVTPSDFAAVLAEAVDLGVTIFGGCCGTTPDFIAALTAALADKAPVVRENAFRRGLCSGTKAVETDRMRVVGERINPTGKKKLQKALREEDYPYILACGVEQQDAGAEILDVNVGLPGIDEPEVMKQTVKALQSVIDLPLQLDSSDPGALEAGLRYYNGKPMVNSVNGNEAVLAKILPLCKKYGAAVVGLAMDETGIPATAEGRIAIARRIVEAAENYGIPRHDVVIDCLTLTAAAEQSQAVETLKAVRYVHDVLGLATTLGVSNISFGLPAREQITVAFLTQALAAGLTLPIVNPNQSAVMDAVAAHRVLSGDDVNAEEYIARFGDTAEPSKKEKTAAPAMTVGEAILKGLVSETAALVADALTTMDEGAVIDTLLIPALDRVGELYESQKIFLPQLVHAANAACAGFDLIKARMAEKGAKAVSRGKLIVATVKGDIHDIGKNIVTAVLENYGYTVIDLGKDVAPEVIVEAAIREDVHLIGLSALMTTTVGSMEETIRALRASGHDCKIWVGGAVLTPEYAKKIGADFYAADAKQSADIAKIVLG